MLVFSGEKIIVLKGFPHTPGERYYSDQVLFLWPEINNNSKQTKSIKYQQLPLK